MRHHPLAWLTALVLGVACGDSTATTANATNGPTTTNSTPADTDTCTVGSEGCACTPGGGCDPGLTCDAGICVPEGTASGGDTGGDTGTSAGNDELGDDAGLDYVEADSCAVETRSDRSGALLGLALLALAGVRRRRAY